jgi:hypothetical protein
MVLNFLRIFILSNYVRAEKANDWRTERILPTAVGISSKQIYFIFMALYSLVCPKLQSREGLMFFLVLFGLLSYFLLVPFRKAIFEYVKDSNVIYEAKKELSKVAGPALSVVFSVITFSIFALSFGLKMYETFRTLK